MKIVFLGGPYLDVYVEDCLDFITEIAFLIILPSLYCLLILLCFPVALRDYNKIKMH